jgi:predicted acetyltransferase
VSRPDEWWAELQYAKEWGTRFDTLFESEDGEIDGYVTYSIKDKWGPAGADNTLTVRDLVAATPDAVHALWRYLCEIDLVRRVHARPIPVDSALPWLLVSPRVARWTNVFDFVWHRVLDVPTALAARRYSVPGQVVITVHDPIRPGGRADGTFAVEGGPDGAQVTATRERPELECDVTTLSTAWCGGVRWGELAAAGRVREHAAGALARADAMFASTPLPFGFTSF